MNKELLQKGMKKIIVFIFCSFLGPIIFYQALKNKDHFFYYPVLAFGIIIMILTVFFGFLGIKLIIISLLGKKKN